MSIDLIARIEVGCITINFLLILILVMLNFQEIKKQFINIKEADWIILILIFLMGFMLRSYISYVFQPQIDGWNFMEEARSILLVHKNGFCFFGDLGNCFNFLQFKLVGYPLLVSVSYLFFGISEESARIVSLIFGSLSIPLIFLMVFLLFNKKSIGLYSALLFAFLPLHIKYSIAPLSDATSLFFILLSLTFFLLTCKIGTKKILFLATLCLTYTIQIRPENFILLPLVLFMVYLFDSKRSIIKSLTPWIILFILLIPTILHIAYLSERNEYIDKWFPRIEPPDYSGFFSFDYFRIIIFWLYLIINNYPNIFAIFALFGVVYLWKDFRKRMYFLMIWFTIYSIIYLVYLIIFALFYPSMVIVSWVKYTLDCHPPIIISLSLGIYTSIKFLKKRTNLDMNITRVLVILLIIIFSFIYFPSNYAFLKGEANADKISQLFFFEKKFASSIRDRVDDQCFIVTEYDGGYTNFFLNRKVININDNNNIQNLLRNDKCVLFYENALCYEFWGSGRCNYGCKQFHDSYKLEMITQVPDSWFRSVNSSISISLYKVSLKKNQTKEGIERFNLINASNLKSTSCSVKKRDYSDGEITSDIKTDKGGIGIIQSMRLQGICYDIETKISREEDIIKINLNPIKVPICFSSCKDCLTILNKKFSLRTEVGVYHVKIFGENKLLNEKTVIVN